MEHSLSTSRSTTPKTRSAFPDGPDYREVSLGERPARNECHSFGWIQYRYKVGQMAIWPGPIRRNVTVEFDVDRTLILARSSEDEDWPVSGGRQRRGRLRHCDHRGHRES